jgi:hypothetical protein
LELDSEFCTFVVWIENGFYRHLCLVSQLESVIWNGAVVICRDRREDYLLH